MANKTDHIELDVFDWEDWGDIDNTGEGEWKDLNSKQKARKAVTNLKGGFVSGVKDRILTRNGQRKYIEKALPKEYGVAYDGVMDTYDAVADIYDEATRELSTLNRKTASTLKPLVDKYNAKLPRKMRDPLKRWTQNASKSNKEWDEGDRDEIQAIAQVNDIFAKQEANRLQQKEVIEQKTQTGMLKNQNTILVELLKTAKATRGYELEVDYVYKRKTLELQYRQFAIQRKILDVQQQTMKLQQASFEKLIHNTGLPDYVKIQTSEVAKQMMTQKVFGEAINRWGEVPNRIIQSMIRNIGKKAITQIKGGGNTGNDMLSMVVQMLTSENYSDDPVGGRIQYGTRGSMNALEWLLSQNQINIPFGPTINVNGPLHRAFEKARKNKKIVAGAQRLQYMQRYGNRKFNEIATGGTTGHGWLDTLLDLGDIRSIAAKNVTTVRKSSKNLDEAALFDIGTKKAVTEVIPGYLSRIHWELIAQRTGNTKHKLMTFDHGKNRFTNVDKLVNQTKSEIYDKNRDSVKLIFKDIFKKMGFNKLSKPAQEAIQRTMVLRALEGQSFDLSILMNSQATKSQKYGLDNKVLSEIQDHLANNKGFKRTSQNVHTSAVGQSTEAFAAMNQIAEALDQLQTGVNNPLDVLRSNVSRGQSQINRKLGITQFDSNGDENVNVAKFISGLLGHGFTNDELKAARKFDAPGSNKKKKPEEMTPFERLQALEEENNQGGSTGSGFSKGGYTGNHGTKTPVGIVHGQEYVFNAQAVKRIGRETLERLNSGRINLSAKTTGKFSSSIDLDRGKTMMFDFLDTARSRLSPGDGIEKAKSILADTIFERYNVITGVMPESLASIRNHAKYDPQLRKLLNRLETLDRLKNAKISAIDKTKALKSLAQEWNSSSLHSVVDTLKSVDGKQLLNQGLNIADDRINDTKGNAKGLFTDFLATAKVSFKPGKEIDRAKEIISDEIIGRYKNLTGRLPENMADLKKKAKNDPYLRQMLNRLETLDRLKQAKLPELDKVKSLKRLAEEWNTHSLSTFTDNIRTTVQNIRDGNGLEHLNQKVRSAGDWIDDSTKSGTNDLKDIWNNLSSYSVGSPNKDPESLVKRTLVQLTKGAFGVGKELAKARFYGFKLVPWALKKMVGGLVHRDSFTFLKYGLWLQDGKEIKLYASGLQEGRYLNGDMKVIEKPADIHGDIYDNEKKDANNQPTLVMTAKEYRKGLFDHEGKQIVKPVGIIGKLARGVTKLGVNIVKGLGNLAIKATKKYISITSWPGRKLIDFIMRERKGVVQDPEALAQITMQDYIREEQRMTNTKLDSVIDNLEHIAGKKKAFNDSDGDGDRDGNAFDQLEAQRNRIKTPKGLTNLKQKDKKEDKPSFLSKIMSMVKGGLGAVIGSMGGLIGMLAKGGIMALLGTFGIKSLLGWLSGRNDKQTVDPNDPRLDPTSPDYDPDFAQPTALQNGAGWTLDKFNGLSPLQQAGVGLAGGAAAWYGGKALIKGGAKLAWKGGKYVANKISGHLATRAAAQAAARMGTQAATSTAARFAGQSALRAAGGFIVRQAGFQALRTGAAALGSAVVGTVGLPVVLGVAAVAALGYGAYRLYKHMKKDEVMISRARMASYGYEIDNEKKVTKLLEVEGYLLENCSVSVKGEVSFKEGTSEAKLQEYFNVNPEDEKSVTTWRKYFFQRFMPVFAQFLTAYKKHTGRTDLHKAEEVMTFEQMSAMLTDTLVKGGTENNPYNVMESGFAGDDEVELNKDEVFEIYATIATKLKNLVKKGAVNKRQKERTKETTQVAKESEKVENETSDNGKKSVIERAKDVVGVALPNLLYKGASALKDKVLGSNSTSNPGASSWLSGLWNTAKEKVSEAVNTVTGGGAGSDAAASSGSSAGSGSANTVAGKSEITKARDIFVALARKAGKSNKWIQSYLANMHRETGGFTVAVENMRYTSASRIREIYGKTIKKAGVSAESLVNNPERLANVVMDDRINNKGLGNKQDGDGFRFRGRGLFQITGRDAYTKVGNGIGVNLAANPDLMMDPLVMAKAAMWYATSYKPAGGDSLEAVTKSIAPGKYQYNLDKAKKHVSTYNDSTINQMTNNGASAAGGSVPAATSTTKGASTAKAGTNTVLASTTGSSKSATKGATPAGTNSVLKSSTGYSKSATVNTSLGTTLNKATGKDSANANAVPPSSTATTSKGGTPWMDIAKKELGVTKPSARVAQYASDTGSGHLGKNYHYCSTFVRWCLKQAGCDLGNTNPMAKSFKGYGQAVDTKNPPYGAVIVMHWGGGKYHVAFSGGMRSDGKVVMLGGNQRGAKGGSDRTGGVVTESSVSTAKIEYAGFPNGYDLSKAGVEGGEGTGQTSTDSGAESKPTKVYAFKVNYMNFNGKGPLKREHDVTVKETGSTSSDVSSANTGNVGSGTTVGAPAGIVKAATGTSSFNVQKFVAHLEAKGRGSSSGYCARYVMNALVAGGIPNSCRQPSAYMYPNALLKHGFHEISMSTTPQVGDIVVNNKGYNGKSQHGHIQGFTGSRWISDFKQNRLVTAMGRMFRHASLANSTPLSNKSLAKPAGGTNDSKKDLTKDKSPTGNNLTGGNIGGRKGNFTGIGTFKTGYNTSTFNTGSKKSDAGTLANAGYRASLGLGTDTNGSSPLGNLGTMNGQTTTKNPETNPVASTLKYELINSNGKRALSFTLKDGSKFIVELDAIGPLGRRTTIDDKEVVITRDGKVRDFISKSATRASANTPQTPDQMAQAVNGKLNPDGSITYPGPDGKSVTIHPKDVGPAGFKTHTGVVLFSKRQMQMPQSSTTDIKRALDKPGTYVDTHGIVRNADGTPALIAGKPVSVTTKDGNITTTITRTPYYQQKLPPEIQKLEEERQKQEALKKAASTSPTTTNHATQTVSNPLTQTAKQVGQQSQQTLAAAQEKAKQDQLKLQQQLAQQKANEVKTQQMQQAQVAKQTQETLSTTAALNEQLKVQRNMLQSLQNIEKHFTGKHANGTESLQGDTYQATKDAYNKSQQIGQTAGIKVKGIPKVEPMSMSK